MLRFEVKKFLWSVATLLFLVNYTIVAQKVQPKRQRDKSEDEILAAVLRYVTLSQKGIVFLRVSGHDPSPETLRLLSVWYVTVLPASRAVFVPVPNLAGAWKDAKTGELGDYFETENIKRISDTRVEIVAGWWQPCGTYTLVFQHGDWSVEGYKAFEICF